MPRLPSEPSLPVTSGGCDGDEGALGGQIVDMEDMMKQHDSIVIFPQVTPEFAREKGACSSTGG